MDMITSYDLICIGNYTRDTIVSPAGTRVVDGGAMNYAAHAAKRLGLKVAVVTRMAEVDAHVVDNFRESGIDCYVTYTASSTALKLEYPTNDPDLRHLSVSSTAGSISPAEVENLHAKAAVIGTTLRDEVGSDVIRQLSGRNIYLAADVQGFIRILRGQSIVNETWAEMEETLPYLDILKSDAVEAEFLTGETDMHQAAKVFANMGPKEILVTHKDGVLLYTGGIYFQAGFYPKELKGRSGRGDTCVGAYTAMRLSKEPGEALVWAAAVTSLKMEKLCPFDGSIGDVEELIRVKYSQGLHDAVR